MGRLLTFGVESEIPHTGYGYIKGVEVIDDLGFAVAESCLLATIGVNNLTKVETPDALLVATKGKS